MIANVEADEITRNWNINPVVIATYIFPINWLIYRSD